MTLCGPAGGAAAAQQKTAAASRAQRRRSRNTVLADPGAAKGERRGRPAVAARQLRLVGDSAMLDAIRKARVRRVAAEMEIGLAGVANRPLADAVVEIEQRSLVGDFGARLGGDEAARRRGRDRRLLVAGTLADEPAGTDRAILELGRAKLRGGT